MNRIFFISALWMILGSSVVCGQEPSVLRFDEQSWDFGTITEANGKVSHRFGFTNTGSMPVVIESVDVSCGCTTPVYSRAPVMPGGRGNIEITYDPTNRPGVFLKKIVVRSGNGRNINTIDVRGTVAPRPRTIQEEYPFEVGLGVRFTASVVNFDRVGQGQTKSMTLGYTNTSPKEVGLRVVPDNTHSWFGVESPDRICAGCSGEITFTYDFRHITIYGLIVVSADIYVDGIKHNKKLLVSALATDHFDGIAIGSAARSKLDAQFYHFGDVSVDGKPLFHEFTLANEGGMPLIIRDVQCGGGVTITLCQGDVIEPDESIRFGVTVSRQPDAGSPDRIMRSVTLVMNDPLRPVREIRMVANLIHR